MALVVKNLLADVVRIYKGSEAGVLGGGVSGGGLRGYSSGSSLVGLQIAAKVFRIFNLVITTGNDLYFYCRPSPSNSKPGSGRPYRPAVMSYL